MQLDSASDGGFRGSAAVSRTTLDLHSSSEEQLTWKSYLQSWALAIGAGIVYFILSGQSNSKVKAAEAQLEGARVDADRVREEAARQAENAKKEAVLERQGADPSALKQAADAGDPEEEAGERGGAAPARRRDARAREQAPAARGVARPPKRRRSTRREHQLSSHAGPDRDAPARTTLDEMEVRQHARARAHQPASRSDDAPTTSCSTASATRPCRARVRQPFIRETEQRVRARVPTRTARAILSTAIQRCAADHVPARSPRSPRSTSPRTTSRAASSAARDATSAPSSR